MIRICKICGKKFEKASSVVKQGGGKFCSNKCKFIGMRTQITRICESCGKEFKIDPSKLKRGWGRFCSNSCRVLIMVGSLAPRYKGGWTDKCGYHIMYINGVETKAHRHVMATHLRRKLTNTEIVHHIDGDPQNNKIENLQLMTQPEHIRLHLKDDSKYKIFECPVCYKEFKRCLSKLTTKTPCCSVECSRGVHYIKTHGTFTCCQCGKIFERYLSHVVTINSCCSISCAVKYRRQREKKQLEVNQL